jgi:hypothetical protein
MRGVVDTVHIRGDKDPAQPGIQALGQRHVAVIEDRCRIQEPLKSHNGPGHGAQQHHDSRLVAQREQDFKRMEAQAGGGVEVEIGMVHAMQSPQQWNRMEHHVLEIQGGVEHEKRHHYCYPWGRRMPVE